MKTLFTIAFLLFAVSASADVYVQGYQRSDGQYVQPYYRSSPNSSQYDNFSTRGNYNPYTGERGTVNPSSRGDFGSTFSHQQQYKSIY
jgi:hypothetical protein